VKKGIHMADLFQHSLTVRELEILLLVATGASAKEIARKLKIAARTVEAHINHLKLKTGARNRAHLVAVSLEYGLISNPCHSMGQAPIDDHSAPNWSCQKDGAGRVERDRVDR
jgi:LuxR family transcriptional regulator, transcriptional regulator of spore coat protein